MDTKYRQKGLTLIELLVVVAVIAILATIAYPYYTKQAQKARRADAKTALEAIALAEERYYTANGNYATALDSLTLESDLSDGDSSRGYYALTLSGVTVSGVTQSFTATAAHGGTGAQGSDSDCTSFSINQLGARTATGDAASSCW